jgi:hypothetical protein
VYDCQRHPRIKFESQIVNVFENLRARALESIRELGRSLYNEVDPYIQISILNRLGVLLIFLTRMPAGSGVEKMNIGTIGIGTPSTHTLRLRYAKGERLLG